MGDRSADDLKQLSRERFGLRADGYRESELHAGGPDLQLLLGWLDAKPGEHALDIATGGGHVALALARTGADVDACDLTPEMLEAARSLLHDNDCTATFAVAEAAALPYADATFDVVTCRIAAHHFPDGQAFFAEVARVLKPGGRFGFQDQALPPEGTSAVLTDAFERTRDESHNQAFNVQGWLTQITRAGLEVLYSELLDKSHDFAEWGRPAGLRPGDDRGARAHDERGARGHAPVARAEVRRRSAGPVSQSARRRAGTQAGVALIPRQGMYTQRRGGPL